MGQDATTDGTPTPAQADQPASDTTPRGDQPVERDAEWTLNDVAELLRLRKLDIDVAHDRSTIREATRLATNFTTMREVAACLRKHAEAIEDVCVRRVVEAVRATQIGATGSAYGDKAFWESGAKKAHDANWAAGAALEERLTWAAGYLRGDATEMSRATAIGEEARDRALARLERIREERGPRDARRLSAS